MDLCLVPITIQVDEYTALENTARSKGMDISQYITQLARNSILPEDLFKIRNPTPIPKAASTADVAYTHLDKMEAKIGLTGTQAAQVQPVVEEVKKASSAHPCKFIDETNYPPPHSKKSCFGTCKSKLDNASHYNAPCFVAPQNVKSCRFFKV